jgi:RsiW-degrading membrane proteinase PrsW (M82 family)
VRIIRYDLLVRAPRWSLRRARLQIGSKLVLVLGLVAYVALIWLIERALAISGAVSLSAPIALVLAAIPAALWLSFFYMLDRHEPEPKDFVVGVFVLGALIAAPVCDFLVRQVAPDPPLAAHGISPFTTERILHAVVVVGLAQELCKYVVVRYTIYSSAEFDEPMDGVVYMMAAGTGFAVWINYHALQDLGHEVFLSTAAAMAVVTTLAHASFAGVLGYVLGRAKFTRRSPLTRTVLLFFGLLLAAFLNGQFQLVEVWISTSGLAQEPWKAIGYAAAFAVVVFALLMLASQRLLKDSPFAPKEPAP